MLVIEQLARLHATSHHYLSTEGMDKVREEHPYYFHDQWVSSEEGLKFVDNLYKEVWNTLCKIAGEFCDKEPLLSKLKSTEHLKLADRMAKVMVPSADGFNCFVHGDPWTNNFMFK